MGRIPGLVRKGSLDAPPPAAATAGAGAALDRILLVTPHLTIGRFDAAPDHPRFHDSGPTSHAIFVFPRTAVRIQHFGADSFVADPNLVTFYNRGQEYRRFAVDPRGDHCDWFAVEPAALASAVALFGRGGDPERPFDFREAPADPAAFLLQRMVIRHLSSERSPDLLLVEEAVGRVLLRLLGAAWRRRLDGDAVAPSRARRQWVEEIQLAIAQRLEDNLSLGELASHCGVSVFYLCRAFRRETGETIHRYRTRLRLRSALDWVTESGSGLSEAALTFGFASHSHFTTTFRREFGLTPVRLRRALSSSLVAELRNRLDAPSPAGGH